MPASALSNGSQLASRYDVVGEYSNLSPRFVAHVAIYDADGGSVSNGQDVPVAHMGPPLTRGAKAKANAVGSVPLTNDEVRRIETWFAGVYDEYQSARASPLRQYHVHPPWKDEVDPNTGVRRYRRYSCVGFVLDAYRQVEITLLEIDEQSLPEIDSRTLALAYPSFPSNVPRIREFVGMEGAGPWRVVLAGYVLHAMDRPGEQIRQCPYRAKLGDERF